MPHTAAAPIEFPHPSDSYILYIHHLLNLSNKQSLMHVILCSDEQSEPVNEQIEDEDRVGRDIVLLFIDHHIHEAD